MSATYRESELPEATRIGRNMQAAVYGTILTLSLIAVSSEYQQLPLRVMGSVLATQAVFYIAHVYAGQLGIRLGRAERRTWPGVAMTAAVNGGFGLVIVALKVLVH